MVKAGYFLSFLAVMMLLKAYKKPARMPNRIPKGSTKEPVAIPDTRAQPLKFNTKATALIQVNFAFSKMQAYKVTSVGIR